MRVLMDLESNLLPKFHHCGACFNPEFTIRKVTGRSYPGKTEWGFIIFLPSLALIPLIKHLLYPSLCSRLYVDVY